MEDPIKNEEPTELEKLQKQSDEYLNNWKRSAADFINYKKDEMERMGMLAKYAKENFIHNILPVLDSIYLAAAAFGEDGFTLVQKQIAEFLKKEDIEEIKTAGQKFNPETMEIVSEETSGNSQLASGTVIEELQRGYKMHEKVLRPAKVKVSK